MSGCATIPTGSPVRVSGDHRPHFVDPTDRPPDRRAVLEGALASSLGLAAMALPSAAVAASGGGGSFPSYTNFDYPTLDGPIFALRVDAIGRVVMGGSFTSLDLASRSGISRVFPDGTLDGTFTDPSITATDSHAVMSLTTDVNGRIIAGGSFSSVGGEAHANIARLLPDGSVDTGFTAATNNTVRAVAVDGQGRIVIAGLFTQVNSTGRSRIARLLSDGSLDPTFVAPTIDSSIFAIVIQTDGKIVIAGAFTDVGGSTRSRIARLEDGGNLDTSYDPTIDGTVFALVQDAAGLVIAGGRFTTVDGASRSNVARVLVNGDVDPSFTGSTFLLSNRDVFSLAITADGRILAGGDFTSVGGLPRNGGVRLLADGTVDPTFADPGADDYVNAIAVDASGRIFFGGWFWTIGGIQQRYFARLDASGSPVQ